MAHKRAARQLQPNRADLTQPAAQTVPNQTYGEAANSVRRCRLFRFPCNPHLGVVPLLPPGPRKILRLSVVRRWWERTDP